MSAQENALIDLLVEAAQSRIDEIRLEMYQSVDAALDRVVQKTLGQNFVKGSTNNVRQIELASTDVPHDH